MSEIKRLYACKNSAEAGMIISLLESSSFHPVGLDTSSNISFAGADQFYYVQIPENEYEEAKKFLVKSNFKNVF